MNKMKKLILSLLLTASVLGMSACESMKGPGGNQMVTGSKTYYYALVYSKITETRYYHIQGWAEYGPDGAYMGEGGKLANYVGIELQLMNGDVIYRYESELSYEMSKQLNSTYATTYGIIGD